MIPTLSLALSSIQWWYTGIWFYPKYPSLNSNIQPRSGSRFGIPGWRGLWGSSYLGLGSNGCCRCWQRRCFRQWQSWLRTGLALSQPYFKTHQLLKLIILTKRVIFIQGNILEIFIHATVFLGTHHTIFDRIVIQFLQLSANNFVQRALLFCCCWLCWLCWCCLIANCRRCFWLCWCCLRADRCRCFWQCWCCLGADRCRFFWLCCLRANRCRCFWQRWCCLRGAWCRCFWQCWYCLRADRRRCSWLCWCCLRGDRRCRCFWQCWYCLRGDRCRCFWQCWCCLRGDRSRCFWQCWCCLRADHRRCSWLCWCFLRADFWLGMALLLHLNWSWFSCWRHHRCCCWSCCVGINSLLRWSSLRGGHAWHGCNRLLRDGCIPIGLGCCQRLCTCLCLRLCWCCWCCCCCCCLCIRAFRCSCLLGKFFF